MDMNNNTAALNLKNPNISMQNLALRSNVIAVKDSSARAKSDLVNPRVVTIAKSVAAIPNAVVLSNTRLNLALSSSKTEGLLHGPSSMDRSEKIRENVESWLNPFEKDLSDNIKTLEEFIDGNGRKTRLKNSLLWVKIHDDAATVDAHYVYLDNIHRQIHSSRSKLDEGVFMALDSKIEALKQQSKEYYELVERFDDLVREKKTIN